MVDSIGKPDARLVDLRFNFIGSFDECDKVKVTHNTNLGDQTGEETLGNAIKGTYFVTYIRMPLDIVPASSQYFVSSIV